MTPAPLRARGRGFALIVALFLLVSLAAIGAFLLAISTMQQESITADEQGARAYQAARAGIEWGAYAVLRDSGGAFATACGGGTTTQTLTLEGGLARFRVRVTCDGSGPFTEGAASVRIYRITANGCGPDQVACPGSPAPDYVERELHLTLTRTN
jgi:MSHA biogenesis protein MshP